MKIAFYGSSLLSSYWNGAATYYRGLLKALAQLGHDIVFFEPDVFDRQAHRDIEPPDWARVVVYPGTAAGLASVLAEAKSADIVIKASGVGFADDALLGGVIANAGPHAVTVFWDVDAPATLAEIRAAADHPLRRALGQLDLVLTYGGGAPVVEAYEALGARRCEPIYNGLDPETHFPVPRDPSLSGELGFLGNRLPDREARVDNFFFQAAALRSDRAFVLGGAGWDDKPMPANVRWIGHVGTARHNAFNSSPKALLNISRDSMASMGFSPATRVFEAAGAGACIITDHWQGIEMFFTPGSEILVARDGAEVAEILGELSPGRARAIGEAALARARSAHTYAERARRADALFREAVARRRVAAA